MAVYTEQTAQLPVFYDSLNPPPHDLPSHPLSPACAVIHNDCDITGSFQNPLKNQLFQLAANFVHIRLVYT